MKLKVNGTGTHRVLRLVCSLFVIGAWAVGVVAKPDPRFKLIAHRGGVVEDKFPDNSKAALQAAAARGYAMLEVDIRETRDGVLVMRHDPDLQLNYYDSRQVADLTWAEIRKLRSDIANQRIWRFDDLVKAARKAKLSLMLDSKAPHSATFCEKVEAILMKYDMVAHCYIIGTRDAMDHFTGKATVGAKIGLLKSKLETDPLAKSRFFLFGHGDMADDTINWALNNGLKVVSSINTFHYYDAKSMAGKPRVEVEKIIMAAAEKDIARHKALGVTEFQIDSEFDRWFRQ